MILGHLFEDFFMELEYFLSYEVKDIDLDILEKVFAIYNYFIAEGNLKP